MKFNLHGLIFEVSSKNKKLLEYSKFRFSKYLTKKGKAEIFFRVFFKKKKILLDDWEKLSSNCFEQKEKFLLKYENLIILYSLEKKRVLVDIFFFPNKKKHLIRILLKGKKATYNDYFEFFIIRKAIQNTLFYFLHKKYGLEILHSATIKKASNASLFFGLGGLGKTTLALKLLHERGLEMMGDNFVFTNGEEVFSFLEPSRVTKYTEGLFNIKKFSEKNPKIKTFKKENLFLKKKYLYNGKCKIKNIFFPVISKKRGLKKISREEAIKRINISMRVLKEDFRFNEIALMDLKEKSKLKKIEFSKKINFYIIKYKNLKDIFNQVKKRL